MELPFTIVFEPPSQKELRTVLRMRGIWVASGAVALAIGCSLVVGSIGRTEAVASGAWVPLTIRSQPSAARVWLDDRDAGATPLHTSVPAGTHSLLLKAADALSARYTVHAESSGSGAALDLVLWRRQALVSRLRSTLPGATLSDARLLADGQVALSLSVPTGQQVQAWRLEPSSGAVAPLVVNAAGARLVPSPDGRLLALLGYDVGPSARGFDWRGVGGPPPSIVWLFEAGGAVPISAWRIPLGAAEELVDASWSPDATRLVAVTTERLGPRAARSRLWLLDRAGSAPRVVLTLPSEIQSGSELWSPDGLHIALVARATGLAALCLLDLDGGFRYVADLDSTSEAMRRYPPAAWSADSQQLLFVAPHQRPPSAPSGWLQPPGPSRALFVAKVAEPMPTPIADTTVEVAAWREDGGVLGIGRNSADGGLEVRLMNGTPSGERLTELPMKVSQAFSVAWDVARARLLVANPTSSGTIDYILLRLGMDDVV